MTKYINSILFTIMCISLPLLADSTLDKSEIEKIIKRKPTIVTYKRVDGDKLKLHIFPPDNPKENTNTTTIIFCFGGSWMQGSPTQFYPQCKYFASRGLLAISTEYRIRNKHGSLPNQSLIDVKSAIRWVRKNAKRLYINPDRIVVSGGSAGGHLAACTAMIEEFEDAKEDLSTSSKPNAIVLFNPMVGMMEGGWGSKFLNDTTKRLSPMHNIKKDLPPFIIFHGTADKTIPFETVENFCKLMKDANNTCELIPFKDKDHGFFNFKNNGGKEFEETIRATEKFLISHGFLEEKLEKNKTYLRKRSSD